MRKLHPLLVAALLLGRPALGADLSRYFPDAPTEEASRRDLSAHTHDFLNGKATWTEKDAARHLDDGADLLRGWMRHFVYCRARAADDVTDSVAKRCMAQSDDNFGAVDAFVGMQLQAPVFTKMDAKARKRAGLDRYQALIARATEGTGHRVDPAARGVVEALGEPMLRGLYDRYDAVTREFKLPPASASRDPDRAVRRAATEATDRLYADHSELFAATLIDIARQENAIAKLYGYDSAPARFYALHLGVEEDKVRELLGRLSRRGSVLKDYQAIRAKSVTKRTGIEEPRSWDMELSNDFTPRALDFPHSRDLILKALEPLGPDYVAQFAWLLDPANGALDLPDGQNRYRGGFSLGFPGVPVMLYVGAYDGSPAKNATMIHEGGHAIERKYLDGVSPYYVSGPRFLFEACAILNELLLLDEEEREAASPSEKIYFQERFLDKLEHEVFTSAEEGAFELGLYSDVAAGRITDAADLNALNGRVIGDYELFYAVEPGQKGGWMKKKLMFEDPLYLINYLYAALVACKFYELDKADPAAFQARYAAFLKDGFELPADALLKKHFGFGLESAPLLDGVLKLMNERVDALEAAYATN